MPDFKFFIDNFDKLLADAGIQVESLTNDLKALPATLEQTIANVQVQAEAIKEQVDATTQQLLSGELFQQDFRPELQKIVADVEGKVDAVLSEIKSAIERAK
jgi:hypothetical protein